SIISRQVISESLIFGIALLSDTTLEVIQRQLRSTKGGFGLFFERVISTLAEQDKKTPTHHQSNLPNLKLYEWKNVDSTLYSYKRIYLLDTYRWYSQEMRKNLNRKVLAEITPKPQR